MGVIEKSESENTLSFFSRAKRLRMTQSVGMQHGSTTMICKNMRRAFDFGMFVGKLALFSKTVGKLRNTDQWLQLNCCLPTDCAEEKHILVILE